MTVKIGLIGCGGIAGAHVKGYLAASENAKVTAVSDIVEENAKRRAQEVGGAQIFSDYNVMLAEADIDAVDILLPHYLHKDAIVAAAKAKKHILCEKPLCLTLDEAAAVKQAVDENGVTLMCAHNQLFTPAIQRARQLLDEGILGDVYQIRTTDSFYHRFRTEDIGWRGHRELIGGGELIDTGYHPSYMLLYLANSKPAQVTALLSKHRLHFMDGEDTAQVLVRFENGAVGNIVTSWAFEPAGSTERFSITGEGGSIYSYGNELYVKMRGKEPEVISFAPVETTFIPEIADFVTCVRDKRRPIHTEVEGIQVLQIILGAYRSDEEKRIVDL
ncbi:MAG: Gfo/Idh/MocA family oxidoreductase [Ktedonobacteraceae bacterium]|nr:Gfo/Idh/MocA family oxidoreductase [Ktedonobacteraceae bacterium]